MGPSPAEYPVILRLARNPDEVVDPQTLIQEAWQPDGMGERDYLRTFVGRPRRKLGDDDPCHPEVVVGMGSR